MKKGSGSESTIIIGPSKSVLVYALHSLEYVLGLARFRVFVPKLYIIIYMFNVGFQGFNRCWLIVVDKGKQKVRNHQKIASTITRLHCGKRRFWKSTICISNHQRIKQTKEYIFQWHRQLL